METRRGAASGIRSAVEVGGSNKHVSTTHVFTFQVDSQPVLYRSGTPAIIDNGDEVIVAGALSNGLLNARAYYNVTRRVSGSSSHGGFTFFGVVFAALAVVFGRVGFTSYGEQHFILVALVFLAIALLWFRPLFKVRAARAAVKARG